MGVVAEGGGTPSEREGVRGRRMHSTQRHINCTCFIMCLRINLDTHTHTD